MLFFHLRKLRFLDVMLLTHHLSMSERQSPDSDSGFLISSCEPFQAQQGILNWTDLKNPQRSLEKNSKLQISLFPDASDPAVLPEM